ncbi:MAG TPA: carboxypeptidase-like regulatory domain-containing protein, partial [Blastocatellia bacterium]|nr:carboxypeptidase-like regulatory domain-containing protein [Blastocatellia bacterium]
MNKLRVVVVSLLISVLSGVVPAQTYQGRILGSVTDEQGAAVRGAKVVITNVETGASRTVESSDSGDYVVPNVAPGLYTVAAEAAGFKKIEHTQVRVEVASDVRIDLPLSAGNITESVTVTLETPQIETTNTTLGGTFSNKSINDLPLNGRDFQNLVVLRPGVQRSTGGGFLSISSNGNRPENNNFIVDGTDNNDPYYGTTVINAEGVQGTPGTILPIDAIQEFNAQEHPNAEYGWKPGAIINLGLKSGTNQIHGTA